MPSYPAYPGPYADESDLADYWRPLSTAEQTRATTLLGAATDRINELPGAVNFVNSACHWVSLDMTKRAMIGGDGDGVKTLSQAMAGMNVNQSFANPTGALYVTAKEVNRLRGRFGQSAGSVVLSSDVRVPLEPWNFQSSQRIFQTTRIDWMMVYPISVTLAPGAERHVMVLAATFWEYEDRTDYAIFTSSDPTVARVDDSGMITAVATGSATITATYEGFTSTCAVTVT